MTRKLLSFEPKVHKASKMGLECAKVQVGMLNVICNMHRITFLVKTADC